jgi:hypothetical protein
MDLISLRDEPSNRSSLLDLTRKTVPTLRNIYLGAGDKIPATSRGRLRCPDPVAGGALVRQFGRDHGH